MWRSASGTRHDTALGIHYGFSDGMAMGHGGSHAPLRTATGHRGPSHLFICLLQFLVLYLIGLSLCALTLWAWPCPWDGPHAQIISDLADQVPDPDSRPCPIAVRGGRMIFSMRNSATI